MTVFPTIGLATALVLSLTTPSAAIRPESDDPPRGDRLEEMPAPFVPKVPRSVEDQARIEATRHYVRARALEDQAQFREAIAELLEAARLDPDASAIPKRLARLQRGLGDIEAAAESSRTALALDPGDPASQILLVGYFLEIKQSPTDAAELLQSILDDPKLDPNGAGAILAHRLLGDLDATLLGDRAAAAREYAKVLEAADGPAGRKLSRVDLLRIFRGDEADAYLQFGAVFLSEGQFDQAIRALRRVLARDPENGPAPRFLAEALLKADRPAEALAALEPYLRKQPQGREPYELLGEILEAKGDKGQFLPRLERAAADDPENLALQFALGERLRDAGRVDEADALLRNLLDDQGDPRVFGPLSESLLKGRQTDPLVKVMRDAADKPGGLDAIRPQIEAIGADPEYADEVLAAALELAKAEPAKFGEDPWRIFAIIATEAKLPDRKIALGRFIIANNPSPTAYRELAVDLLVGGQFAEAAETARALIDKYPNQRSGQTLDLLARSLFLSGQIAPALEVATEASELAPDDPELLLLLGFIEGRLGRNQEAVDRYRAILDRFAGQEAVERRARSGLSSTYDDMGEPDRAEAELEAVFEDDPEDPGINNDLGYLYAEHGKNLERAESMIRSAVEVEPENRSYLDSLGWVLFKRGKAREALEPLEKAAKDPSVDATVLDHLGDVYYELRRYEAAGTAWGQAEREAAKSDPPDERLESIRAKLAELKELAPEAVPMSTDDQDPVADPG